MKLRIFEEKESPRKEKEKEVFLRLMSNGYGDVTLEAWDSNGVKYVHGNLLQIRMDGTYFLMGNINPNLGFKRDTEGHLQKS